MYRSWNRSPPAALRAFRGGPGLHPAILRSVKLDRRTRRGILISALPIPVAGFVLGLLSGHVSGAVWSAITAAVAVWLIIRLRPARERRQEPTAPEDDPWASFHVLGVGLVFLGVGTVLAIVAVQSSSGGELAFLLALTMVVLFAGVVVVAGAILMMITPPSSEIDTSDTPAQDRPNPDARELRPPEDH